MALKIGESMPWSGEAEQWLNGKPTVADSASLVYFWAISCPACKFNMPRLHSLRDKYAGFGVSVIAIHMPRGEEDLDVDRVQEIATKLSMTEPCAIDNDLAIGSAFQTGGVWPAYFLFDGERKLRCRAAGGFGVKMMERTLARMFPDALSLEKPDCPCGKTGGCNCQES